MTDLNSVKLKKTRFFWHLKVGSNLTSFWYTRGRETEVAKKGSKCSVVFQLWYAFNAWNQSENKEQDEFYIKMTKCSFSPPGLGLRRVNESDEYKLRRELFENMDVMVRPVTSYSDAVGVSFSMTVRSLNDLVSS